MPKADVFAHIHMREQGVILKHHAHLAALGGKAFPSPLTVTPPSEIRPACAASRPAIARSNVVLPQPEGPISTPISPARQAKAHTVHRKGLGWAVARAEVLEFEVHGEV